MCKQIKGNGGEEGLESSIQQVHVGIYSQTLNWGGYNNSEEHDSKSL